LQNQVFFYLVVSEKKRFPIDIKAPLSIIIKYKVRNTLGKVKSPIMRLFKNQQQTAQRVSAMMDNGYGNHQRKLQLDIFQGNDIEKYIWIGYMPIIAEIIKVLCIGDLIPVTTILFTQAIPESYTARSSPG